VRVDTARQLTTHVSSIPQPISWALRRPWAVILALTASALLIRTYFVVNHAGYWGVDGGAYLLSARWVQGIESTHTDFIRPWLAPGWLLVPLIRAFGPDGALKAFAVLTTLPFLLPLWLLCRQFLSPWQTVFVIFAVLTDWMLAEMFTAGSLPLLAFAPTLLAAWCIWRLAHHSTWRLSLTLAVSLALIPYVNQTSAGIALSFFPLYTLAVLVVTRRLSLVRRLALPVLGAALLALPAWPFYRDVGIQSDMLRYPGPLVTFYTVDNAAWIYALTLLPFALLSIWRGSGLVRALGLVLLIMAPVSCLVSYSESLMNIFYRLRYMQMLLFWPLAAYWGARFFSQPDWRWLRAPVVGALLLLLPLGWLYQMQVESKLGRMVSPDSAAALDWLQRQPHDGAIGTNSYSLSLYVAALTQRRSPWVQIYSPPKAYVSQHNDMVCLVGWRPGCDVAAADRRLGLSYLLVERLWPTREMEVARVVPDLTPVYDLLQYTSPWGDDQLGKVWDAPMEQPLYPWAVTDRNATWLTPVWRQGTVQIWRIEHAEALQ